MTRLLRPPEQGIHRSTKEFNPVVQGTHYRLPRELALTIWKRVCADATDSFGRRNQARAQQRFHEVAARIAARGGRLRPDVGRLTRVGVELDGVSAPGSDVEDLAVPGRETLVMKEARRWTKLDPAAAGVDAAVAREPSEQPGASDVAQAMAALQVPRFAGQSPAIGAALTPADGIEGATTGVDHSDGFGINTIEQAAQPESLTTEAGIGRGLPFRPEMERLFGERLDDIVVANNSALPRGALAAAERGRIIFTDATPSKETVAHEVAHVLQYRRGQPETPAVLGERGDPAEREAHRAAADVLAGRAVQIVRAPRAQMHLRERAVEPPELAPAASTKEVEATIAALAGEVDSSTEAVDRTRDELATEPDASALSAVLSGGGRPLPEDLRTLLQATAGRELSEVRIHDDPAAGHAAQALGAQAFALKQDIYFAPGAYDPSSTAGRRLIAHEVVHTQQPEGPMRAGVTTADDLAEREAHVFVDAAMHELQVPATTTAVAEPARTLIPVATRTRIPRFPGVVKAVLDADKLRWIDPGDHSQGKVWQEDRGYIKNPTSTKLSNIVGANNKVGGGFDNGKFMYVIDQHGDVWVGKRLNKNMPHPTLIGGKNPQVLGAGTVQIEGGKIVKIDTHSGHFQPPRTSLSNAVKSFLKLPKAVFKNFSAESVHVEGGNETRRVFNSLRMLKLKSFNPTKTINRLQLRYKNDPKFKGRINSGLKNAGKAGLAIIASLVLQYFIGKWLAQLEAQEIQKSIDSLAPEVEAALLQSLEAQVEAFDALADTNPDAKVYINIVYRLSWIESFMPVNGEVMSSEGFAGAQLLGAEFSQTRGAEGLKDGSFEACFGTITKYKQLSMSEEIRVGDLYGEDGEKPDDLSTPKPKQPPGVGR